MKIYGKFDIISTTGDVMHRRSTYFKKRQADFDPLSRETGSKQKMLKINSAA